MKKLYATLFTWGVLAGAQAQSFSMGDLVSLTNYNSNKFDNYMAKKGFRSAGWNNDSLAYNYFDKKAKEVQPDKLILKCDKEDKAVVAFQTVEQSEFDALCEQLKSEGYRYTENGAVPSLYQKGSITITTEARPENDKTVYSFIVEKKALPRARDIQFAEDFLALPSHEYLAAVFGEANVKRDLFYFSENEVNKCSVLFPNTNMQAIFIWKDEANSRDIAFILLGGQVQAKSSLGYNRQIELNAWQSKQGIRSGMTLRELEALNGKSITLHGWDTDQPGVVAANNSGTINFKNIRLALNCLDCNGDRYYSKNSLLNSADLLAQDRRVYVSTLILLPGKN